MQRGLRKAKTPKEVKKAGRSAAKDVAVTAGKIIGIGLVAGTALVMGTNQVMKKLFGSEKQAKVEAAEEAAAEAPEEAEETEQ